MQSRPHNLLARAGAVLADGVRGLDDLLFPPSCVLCQAPIDRTDDGLCPSCWQELVRWVGGDYCRRCGR